MNKKYLTYTNMKLHTETILKTLDSHAPQVFKFIELPAEVIEDLADNDFKDFLTDGFVDANNVYTWAFSYIYDKSRREKNAILTSAAVLNFNLFLTTSALAYQKMEKTSVATFSETMFDISEVNTKDKHGLILLCGVLTHKLKEKQDELMKFMLENND